MRITTLMTIAAIAFPANSMARPTCNIAPDKKALIASVLCGQAAPEPEYRQEGPGCLRRSLEKRLEDSAVQLHLYRICDDEAFASRMESALVNTIAFMEKLAPCVDEDIDVQTVMDERTAFVRDKASSLTCTAQHRALLQQRRPAFEAMMTQATDPAIEASIFRKLGIDIDPQGNVVDQ